MSALDLAFVALVISADNFAAALALGSLGQERRRWRIATAFGAAGAAAPIVGIVLGQTISGALEAYAGRLGVAVLAGLGGWTIRGARNGGIGERAARRASGGAGLLLLAAGVSADNLVVGVGLGLSGGATWKVGAAAGACVFLLTLLGLRLGQAARRHWERYATFAAGALLLALAAALALGWV